MTFTVGSHRAAWERQLLCVIAYITAPWVKLCVSVCVCVCVCVCMCVLSPWWVKRSLWTMSIRQSSFCFTRRPRGTFRMNSVNSLLQRQEEDNEEKKKVKLIGRLWMVDCFPSRAIIQDAIKKKKGSATPTQVLLRYSGSKLEDGKTYSERQ